MTHISTVLDEKKQVRPVTMPISENSKPIDLDLSALQHEVGLEGELADYTFANWHDDKQQTAKGQCLAFFENQRSLVLWSVEYGSGKTYAAAAVLNEWLRRDVGRKDPRSLTSRYYVSGRTVIPNGPAWKMAGAFVKTSDLFAKLKSLVKDEGSQLETMVKMLQTTPLLVMDDLCRGQPTAFENDVVYRIIDYRSYNALPCVITTNAKPTEVSKWLWGATASRLKLANWIHFDDTDYRGR